MKISLVCLIVIIFSYTVFVFASDNPQTAAEPSKKTEDNSGSPQTSISAMQKWALGCAAILTERNHDRHDLLGARFRTPKNIEDCKRFLIESGWDIKNQTDLLDSLMWIENEGHCQSFKQLGEKLKALTDGEYQKMLADNQADKEILNRIQIAAKYYMALGDKSLFGWDYGRYICLCRWGYMAGYLSEEEAWQKIMPVAKLLQEKFNSWQDLGQNYLIGRRFWSHEDSQQNGYQYEDAFLRLCDMPSSPWNKLPWDMSLTEKQGNFEPDKADVGKKIN